MSKKKYNLVITAHPDDETIFMGGTIMSRRENPWWVICVTDGNADGMGKQRAAQFNEAGKSLGIKKMEHWDFEDLFEKRLPIDKLVQRLGDEFTDESLVERVFTHGALGEYGHPHHQDVCVAAHRAFAGRVEVMSIAYNSLPVERVELSPEVYLRKQEILRSTYFSETERFIQLLPATFSEGYSRVSLKEVEAIYRFLTGQGDLDSPVLKVYRPLIPYLLSEKNRFSQRL